MPHHGTAPDQVPRQVFTIVHTLLPEWLVSDPGLSPFLETTKVRVHPEPGNPQRMISAPPGPDRREPDAAPAFTLHFDAASTSAAANPRTGKKSAQLAAALRPVIRHRH
jgi:hypothetical protein